MTTATVILAVSLTCILSGYVGDALECCTEYTDLHGEEHTAERCQEYCCTDIYLTKKCCSDESLRVPSNQRTEDCSWISRHIPETVCGTAFGVISIIVSIVCCCLSKVKGK